MTVKYDIFIIGGGINGAGIARDAAGSLTPSREIYFQRYLLSNDVSGRICVQSDKLQRVEFDQGNHCRGHRAHAGQV